MFYSTEILTSRKYGVATVWLVATLGSKSSLKKVSRKAILDVDVQKACSTIENPEAPMALRLQSNLLYGVARVYAQQCGYVLSDAEAANNTIKTMATLLNKNNLVLSKNTHKARAGNLVLPDDPNFLTELDLDHDMLDLDCGGENGQKFRDDSLRMNGSSDVASCEEYSRISSQGRSASIEGLEIQIPASASSFVAGGYFGGIGGGSSAGGSAGRKTEFDGFLDDLFEVGPDGQICDAGEGVAIDPAVGRDGADLESGISSIVRRDHERGPLDEGIARLPDEDDYVPLPGDDYIPLVNDDEVLPEAEQDAGVEAYEGDQEVGQRSNGNNAESSTTTATAQAPARQARPPKVLQLDTRCELRNSDLQKWGTDYLRTMKDLLNKTQGKEVAALAKKNAAFWVIGTGSEAFGFADQGPMHIFSGQNIFDICRKHNVAVGWKRPRDADEEVVQSSGRKRSRTREPAPTEHEQGRGVDEIKEFVGLQDDEYEMNVEQGREAPTPLDDRHLSTLLPWNRSSSHRPTGLFSAGFRPSSSVGGALPLTSRRGSRLVSASPLHGKGDSSSGGDDDNGIFDTAMLGVEDVDFQLFGPATTVETQTAAQFQWLRSTLETESMNFFGFVQTAIEEADAQRLAAAPGDEEDEAVVGSIDFSALLRPTAGQLLLRDSCMCCRWAARAC